MDTSPLLVNVLGFVATAFAIFMWVPQARITWSNRNNAAKLAGVSETTQWLSAVSYLLWGVFGALSGSFWVMAPSLVSFPLSVATIFVVRRGRRLSSTTTTTTTSIPIIPLTSGALPQVTSTSAVPALGSAAPATSPVPIIGGGTPTTTEARGPGAYSATGAIPVLV